MNNTFEAIAPPNFPSLMLGFWMMDERFTEQEAIEAYWDNDFISLIERVIGNKAIFERDTGYTNLYKNTLYCFETVDNNFVIPISILEVV